MESPDPISKAIGLVDKGPHEKVRGYVASFLKMKHGLILMTHIKQISVN